MCVVSESDADNSLLSCVIMTGRMERYPIYFPLIKYSITALDFQIPFSSDFEKPTLDYF